MAAKMACKAAHQRNHLWAEFKSRWLSLKHRTQQDLTPLSTSYSPDFGTPKVGRSCRGVEMSAVQCAPEHLGRPTGRRQNTRRSSADANGTTLRARWMTEEALR
jgi:hypothetical protein